MPLFNCYWWNTLKIINLCSYTEACYAIHLRGCQAWGGIWNWCLKILEGRWLHRTLLFSENYKIISYLWSEFNAFLLKIFSNWKFKYELSNPWKCSLFWWQCVYGVGLRRPHVEALQSRMKRPCDVRPKRCHYSQTSRVQSPLKPFYI